MAKFSTNIKAIDANYDAEVRDSVTKVSFDIRSGTTRTFVAVWRWSREHTKHFNVEWRYLTEETGDSGTWITGETATTTDLVDEYTAPEEAIKVVVNITPIATTYQYNQKEVPHWTAQDSTDSLWTYVLKDAPEVPGAPTIEIDGTTLKVKLDNLKIDKTPNIEFRVVKNNIDESYKKSSVPLVVETGSVSEQWTVDAGGDYKAQCRSYDPDTQLYSAWSDYSATVSSLPTSPIINSIEVTGNTTISITWTTVSNAEQYSIQYIKKSLIPEKYKYSTLTELFSYNNIDKKEVQVAKITGDTNKTITYNLNLGDGASGEYYIRVKSVNKGGTASEGSELIEESLKSFIIGTDPTAPTTWSSSNTVVVGEKMELFWLHNSEDGSKVTKSELVIIDSRLIDSVGELVYVIDSNAYESEDGRVTAPSYDPKKDSMRSCIINTSMFSVGSSITWKVRTAGSKVDENGDPVYGPYSIERKLEIYNQPSLSVILKDIYGEELDFGSYLSSFPLKIKATVGQTSNQKPISYYVNIIANNAYTTVNNIGQKIVVNEKSSVYASYFDTNNTTLDNVVFSENSHVMELELSANHIDLVNNVSYSVEVTVAMSSGLSAEEKDSFTVGWAEDMPIPGASVSIDKEIYSASIKPIAYSEEDDAYVTTPNYKFSVYRREFNGAFTEIATNVPANTYVTDPHPALNFARYRIVCKSLTTGAVSFTDLPAIPVDIHSVIIQWDELWQNYNATNGNSLVEQPYVGSRLVLPYNISIDENFATDSTLVDYIGRERSVAYYGTQKKHTSTWNVEIPKTDVETLYAITRLAEWMGDVYVRQPSGNGYWANISVSYSQNYKELVIPISFSVTRVEGGM